MTQFHKDTIIHLVAGGVAGTVGAIVTCPLEVVKTRLQSSSSGFTVTKVCVPKIASSESCSSHTTCKTISPHQRRRLNTFPRHAQVNMIALAHCGLPESSKTMGLMQCIRHIVETEGPRALFKGLGPNLVGVAPSRAIYFCAYSQTKSSLNSLMKPDTAIVHVLSASCAGFVACTATNPIWFVKTRLQLDYTRSNRLTAFQCIKRIYVQKGLLGFYKGITASYWGVSETVVHFVIYEAIKARLIAHRMDEFNRDAKTSKDFLEFMLAGAVSKTIASCIAYPHEVARTRLREEGNKYRGFWQTLRTVYTEEGHRGVYRGLATQLVRQIPNTAIMMATYEAVVYLLTSYSQSSDYYEPTNR